MSDLKIFTDLVDPKAVNQVYSIAKHPVFCKSKVRIMPDVHVGKGCVVGFTATLGDMVIPNVVGSDIGCGMLTVKLGNVDINLSKLDTVIRERVPSGRSVQEKVNAPVYIILDKLKCKERLRNVDVLWRSCGTLGGGNHFIEVDEDEDGCKYLIIHTGSRNLGKQVADIYQNLAVDLHSYKRKLAEAEKRLIEEYKSKGKHRDIQNALEDLKKNFIPKSEGKVPAELSYLTGYDYYDYLHDMDLCVLFAKHNREYIASAILDGLGVSSSGMFHTVHNYIDTRASIVRKGAISATRGERVLIPLNMRDGCIIGTGLGNRDWNCSAPHGAGRVLSRSQAKEFVSIDDYKDSMKGIYSTSVCQGTIDESPMAYKPSESIIEGISETVRIDKIIKPIYNYKAC